MTTAAVLPASAERAPEESARERDLRLRCNELLEESRELRRALHAAIPLGEVLAELGTDERRVLLVLAKRLLEGQKLYGRLDLANDPRDFRRERAMEIADLLVYSAFAELQQATRGA